MVWKNLPSGDGGNERSGDEGQEESENREYRNRDSDTERRDEKKGDESTEPDIEDDENDEDWTPGSDQASKQPVKDTPLVHELLEKEWLKPKIDSNEQEPLESEDHKAYAARWYEALCTSIKTAADKVLPKKKGKHAPERLTSERTKRLMAKRTRMNRKNSSRAQFRRIQKKIKESCLKDYVRRLG